MSEVKYCPFCKSTRLQRSRRHNRRLCSSCHRWFNIIYVGIEVDVISEKAPVSRPAETEPTGVSRRITGTVSVERSIESHE